MVRSATRCALASLCLLVAAPAGATQHVVPDDFATIQAACDAAAPGDSVLVRDGTYVESIVLAGKQLTIFSADSPVLTTNANGRMLEITGASDVTLIGLVLKGGNAADGGALRLMDSHVSARSCTFASNRAHGGGGHGGAVYLGGAGSRLDVEDCTFESNFAGTSSFNGNTGNGGAVYGEANTAMFVRRSALTHNIAAGFEGGPGSALCAAGAVTCELTTFTDNFGESGTVFARLATIRGCAFRGNSTAYGSAGVLAYGGGSIDSLTIENCTFTDNGGQFEGLIDASGPCRIVGNTIAYNTCGWGAAIHASPRWPHLIERNIVVHTTGIGIDAYVGIACNDVWQNSAGNYRNFDFTGIDDNVSADPGFCGASIRDLRLHDTSLCTAAHNGCGARMGAYDVGCMTVAAQPLPISIVRLLPVAPNPGSPPLRFAFTLPVAARARLAVRDVAGRTVTTLVDAAFDAGVHEARWDGAISGGGRARPGVYFAALTAGGRTTTRAFSLVE